MAKYDLTTLYRVRAWLGIEDNNTTMDQSLQREITRMSALTLSWLNQRTMLNVQYDEILSGTGSTFVVLRNRPATSIVALSVAGAAVPANTGAAGVGSGYTLMPWNGAAPAPAQQLVLTGYAFQRGVANIALSYKAGYKTTLDPVTIPSTDYQVDPIPLCQEGLFALDMGVSMNGAAMAPVTSNPASGQYIAAAPLMADPATGKAQQLSYTFAAADAGNDVVITCSYIPHAVEQAVCELVGERWRYKDRIGQRSKTLGGQETTGYDPNDLPLWFKSTLSPFQLKVPL